MMSLVILVLCTTSYVLAGTIGHDFDAIAFLETTGYLEHVSGALHHAPDDINQAVKNYQIFNHLPLSGHLDKQTVRLMKRPRCGFPDIIKSTNESRQLAPLSYTTIDKSDKWIKMDLTYKIMNYTPDLKRKDVDRVIAKAFKAWADVTTLTFRPVKRNPDFKLRFGSGVHKGCPPYMAFDGEGGILAHTGTLWNEDSEIHFDEDEKWELDYNGWGVNLLQVATHEIGHGLGMMHSDDMNSVMYAYYGSDHLSEDDRRGILSLYGPKRN